MFNGLYNFSCFMRKHKFMPMRSTKVWWRSSLRGIVVWSTPCLSAVKVTENLISIPEIGEERAIFLLSFTCNYVVSVRSGFLFPIGAWDRLRHFIVALPGPSI